MPDYSNASRTHRGANRKFTESRGVSGEDQVGHVCADDQEQESDCAEQDEQWGSGVVDDLAMHRIEGRTPVQVGLGKLIFKTTRNRVQLALRLFGRNSALETADHDQVMSAAYSRRIKTEDEGHPEFDSDWIIKIGFGDAYDRAHGSVDIQGPP